MSEDRSGMAGANKLIDDPNRHGDKNADTEGEEGNGESSGRSIHLYYVAQNQVGVNA